MTILTSVMTALTYSSKPAKDCLFTISTICRYISFASIRVLASLEIDFSLPAKKVHDLIRGLSPIPLAFTYTPNGKLLKISASELSKRSSEGYTVGCVVSTDNDRITVACADGCIDILSVLPEGKRRMSAADFIRGRGISVGERLGK